MKIGVAYDNGNIAENFGSCNVFACYNYTGEFVNEVEKTVFEARPMSSPEEVAKLLMDKGIEALICGNMSADAKNALLSLNVVPIAGFCGDADTASDMLAAGQLPLVQDGGCSGCCEGCGGGCGDGGCGDGCGCGDEDF